MNEYEVVPTDPDLAELTYDDAVAFLVHTYGMSIEDAKLRVSIVHGDITGHVNVASEADWLREADFTGEAGPPPRWMVTADAR